MTPTRCDPHGPTHVPQYWLEFSTSCERARLGEVGYVSTCVHCAPFNLVWPDNPDFVALPFHGDPRLAHVLHYMVISRMPLFSWVVVRTPLLKTTFPQARSCSCQRERLAPLLEFVYIFRFSTCSMSTASNQPEAPPGYGDLGDELERHARVKHIEQLEAGKAHTCVRLIVESRAKTPKHRPFFVTEDAVRGVVEIEYELIKLAKEVSIAVRSPRMTATQG